MATLTAGASTLVRVFRLDQDAWRNLAATGTFGGAALITIGAYAILAFDRLGIQGMVDPRATVRLLMVGFYGWLWLAVSAWAIGRVVLGADAALATVLRLYGNAHLPLVFVGIGIQVFSVVARTQSPALVIAVLAGLVWMPAMLVAATRVVFDLEPGKAALVVAGPYLVWLLTVGRYLLGQLGHLL